MAGVRHTDSQSRIIAPGPAGGPLGIYVHVPFCVRKCSYCDFVSYPLGSGESEVDSYLTALSREVAWADDVVRARGVETIYVGGGTPTALETRDLGRLLRLLKPWAESRRGDLEFTVEANPGTLDVGKVATLLDAGVSRLSLGAQSMNDATLRRIGRIHSAADVADTVRLARSAGFESISLDLISGLPGDTRDSFAETLRGAISLGPDHISVYALSVEPGTPLAAEVEAGSASLPDEDEDLAMFELTGEVLAKAGFQRYEVSNFARPGRESRHNLIYWQNREYVGIGPAAHSHLDSVRYGNVRGLRDYAERLGSGAGERSVAKGCSPAAADREVIDAETARGESMWLGLRLMDGVNKEAFARRHGVRLEEVFARELAEVRRQGLVEETPESVRLSKRGLPVANQVFALFV